MMRMKTIIASLRCAAIEDIVIATNRPGTRQDDRTSSQGQELFGALSSFDCLSHSFRDRPLEIVITQKTHRDNFPVTRIDRAFRDWPNQYQTLIFESLWLALGQVLHSQARRVAILSQPLTVTSIAIVVTTTIRALTASIPRAEKGTWEVVQHTLANGLTDGQQDSIHSKRHVSCSLRILDAFESESALRLVQRLVQVIAARSRIEEAPITQAIDRRTREIQLPPSLRQMILKSLIEEQRELHRTDRDSGKFKDESRDQFSHCTNANIWLEWLRKCFLKHWNGDHRLARYGVAHTILELMEDLWSHRSADFLDISDNFFPTPALFNHLNVERATIDWIHQQYEPLTRHLFSFHFLFGTRDLTMIFRGVNHRFMRHAYSTSSAIQKMRLKTTSRASVSDNAYLDQRLKIAQEPYLVLRINRHSVLADANNQLWHRMSNELRKPLRIRMGVEEGEIGHDLGGVQIEFFKLACAEALNPDYSLFTIDPHSHLAWFQPGSMVPLYKFQLFGTLFALAVYNGVTLPVSFPLALYRKLLTGTYGDTDLEQGWPELAKALQDLCAYNGSVEDDLARDYTFSFAANGLYIEADMVDPWQDASTSTNHLPTLARERGQMRIHNIYPDKHHPELYARTNGKDMAMVDTQASAFPNSQQEAATQPQSLHWPGWELSAARTTETPPTVTNLNREGYARDYTRWILDYSIRPQFLAFAKGFHSVVDSKALKLLTPETLRAIVEGSTHLDIDLLEKAATYRGYEATSDVVKWFWEIVKDYSEENQKLLLEFVTASSRVPVNGTESLTFVIERLMGDSTSLPGSSTCFSTLRLPEYESKDILEHKLTIALQHSLGFGQA
ncbi:hypothetical protein AAFC00_000536 [Neodothiora populina]